MLPTELEEQFTIELRFSMQIEEMTSYVAYLVLILAPVSLV